MLEVISRREARERGLKRYFTGAPCKHGHIDERYVSGKVCIRCANSERQRENIAAWRLKHPEKLRAQAKKWVKDNPDKINAMVKASMKRVRVQRPPWADRKGIWQFYQDCPSGYDVDHIIPLKGELVSGLHVLENLQYLPSSLNRAKGNRWTPDWAAQAPDSPSFPRGQKHVISDITNQGVT